MFQILLLLCSFTLLVHSSYQGSSESLPWFLRADDNDVLPTYEEAVRADLIFNEQQTSGSSLSASNAQRTNSVRNNGLSTPTRDSNMNTQPRDSNSNIPSRNSNSNTLTTNRNSDEIRAYIDRNPLGIFRPAVAGQPRASDSTTNIPSTNSNSNTLAANRNSDEIRAQQRIARNYPFGIFLPRSHEQRTAEQPRPDYRQFAPQAAQRQPQFVPQTEAQRKAAEMLRLRRKALGDEYCDKHPVGSA